MGKPCRYGEVLMFFFVCWVKRHQLVQGDLFSRAMCYAIRNAVHILIFSFFSGAFVSLVGVLRNQLKSGFQAHVVHHSNNQLSQILGWKKVCKHLLPNKLHVLIS